mmetsp:Transcript_11569/g.24989  ORF Transcript_11569/g.24989 Transcript_11569/m.24989 type:complete len:289 (+) Transcript_11569:742-1608(+)
MRLARARLSASPSVQEPRVEQHRRASCGQRVPRVFGVVVEDEAQSSPRGAQRDGDSRRRRSGHPHVPAAAVEREAHRGLGGGDRNTAAVLAHEPEGVLLADSVHGARVVGDPVGAVPSRAHVELCGRQRVARSRNVHAFRAPRRVCLAGDAAARRVLASARVCGREPGARWIVYWRGVHGRAQRNGGAQAGRDERRRLCTHADQDHAQHRPVGVQRVVFRRPQPSDRASHLAHAAAAQPPESTRAAHGVLRKVRHRVHQQGSRRRKRRGLQAARRRRTRNLILAFTLS